MPNIWTHMLFCEDVVDSIGKPNPFPKLERIMNLGAQGPDPFFYYNFWPWVKDEPVNEIGLLLHQKHCGEFLMDLIVSVKNKSEELKAYVFGFITHHILDRNTHPYVHYRAGYEGSKHQKLEIIIDTIMMKRNKNMDTWKVPVYKEINVGSTLNEDLVELLYERINKYYPEAFRGSPSYINKSYSDMKLALRILADPYHWKNKLFKSLVSSFSHQPVNDDVDYLNINNEPWYHPATNEPSTKSFIDLYEQGRIEAIEILTAVLSFWEDELPKHTVRERIGDISYDTGKPLKLRLENRYSDPIV
ncbi:zinc dependent phospholipase C family protein [Ornithinibacillus halophilus]|uniref:Zinc dependent phospholipase C n=1 Tax=Ornithinibacillus halophilus TaxID=930117 RepID=A0A1M5NIX7_9BACI|nr:zinc dependent phospholipase C family protein [Ornithinibacillus halophilus]SHG89481.1 Zinc dependent phospholipase C [Ornithinibacillus halophilus]